MIKNIFYWKYAKPFTPEEKEAKFKLIKKQMKNAKCFDDVPALQPCIMFWELYRALKAALEDVTGCKINIDYRRDFKK